MAKMDKLLVWDEDPDSFDDFSAQCRWYRDGLKPRERSLATAHIVRLFAAKGGKTWNLIQTLEDRFLKADFGMEYLIWRIKELVVLWNYSVMWIRQFWSAGRIQTWL